MTTNQGVGGSNPSWVTMKSAKQQFSGFFIVRKGAFGHTCGVRVEGPLARGFWPPDGGRLCRRVEEKGS